MSVRLLGEPDAAQPLVRLLARVLHVVRAREGADHDVFGDRHALEGPQLLEGTGDAAAADLIG